MLIDCVGTTLRYDPGACIGCGMCIVVCPHGVFAENAGWPGLVRWEAWHGMRGLPGNCPVGAIVVESGVGCASAMIVCRTDRKKDDT